MPRVKTTAPEPSREKGQRSLDLPNYLTRWLPPWNQPQWMEADAWRRLVANQPIVTVCRDTLISNIVALDWKIEPRDSTKRDEYKKEIEYYEKFLHYTGEFDYVDIIEWVGKDFLDIPFGGAVEVGREGDAPNGKVLWIEPLDGGTLFPTLNSDFPVGQMIKDLPTNAVFFPKHAINRIYSSPRTDIKRKGWGMPPPEKIYLALQLLNRGDVYYANLLLDTPEVGILDLADMDKTSAEEWVKSWRSLLTGIDPFKIPVLYEHEKPINFVQFKRSPTELMFDTATSKYASICAAGFGMSLSDIGFQGVSSGGETLAGTIRQERRTRRTGFAVAKAKFKSFFDRLLPDYLEFKFIDLDDEQSVARGRSRLADATAWVQLIDKRIVLPNEARHQMIADGLISISIPEDVPEDQFPDESIEKPAERPSLLGRPVAPSAGGQGEVRSDLFTDEINRIFDISDVRLRRLIRSVIIPLSVEVKNVVEILEDDDLDTWNEWHDAILWDNPNTEIPELTLSAIGNSLSSIKAVMNKEDWWKPLSSHSDIANELLDVFKKVRRARLLKKSEFDYELAITDKIIMEFPDDPSLSRKFNSRIKVALSDVFELLQDYLCKAVISGTRRFLSIAKIENELDDGIIIDNNAMEFVRSSLQSAKNELLSTFAETVSETINKLLEDK